jgi:hypothetical protein
MLNDRNDRGLKGVPSHQKREDLALSEKKRREVEKMLEASGFPLEIEMSSLLEERDWTVAPSIFYQDLDQRNLREIDIIASKTCYEDSSGERFEPYELRLTLIIECKKSEKFNWVFYTRPIGREIMLFPLGFPTNQDCSTLILRSVLELEAFTPSCSPLKPF